MPAEPSATDREQERWIAQNVRLRGQVVVDVGANVGRLSRFFWEAGAGTTRVVSVEPLEENVRSVEATIIACGATGWTVVPAAVSDHDGEVELRVAADSAVGWNSVVTAGSGADVRRVPARRLPELVPDATVVKIDIEGHEYAVLDDALPRMPRVHTWILELHMVPGVPLQTVLGALAARGYELFAAGRRPGVAGSPRDAGWIAAPIPASLDWSRIPAAGTGHGGAVFKMLHVLARRPGHAP